MRTAWATAKYNGSLYTSRPGRIWLRTSGFGTLLLSQSPRRLTVNFGNDPDEEFWALLLQPYVFGS